MRSRISIDISFFSSMAKPALSAPGQNPLRGTDDTWRAASHPSTFLLRHRAFLQPASCIPNRWDENGRPRAAAARSIAYRYAKSPALVPAFRHHLPERLLDFGERRADGRPARIDHDIPAGVQLWTMQSKDLAESSFQTIANHRVSQRFGRGNAEPGTGIGCLGIASQTERRGQRIRHAEASVIDGTVIGGAQDPRRFRKQERGRGRTGGGTNWLSQSGQLFRR